MDALFDAIRSELPPGCMRSETSWNGAAFVGGLCSLVKPDLAFEIGSKRGTTSAYIAASLRDLGSGGLVCFEISEEGRKETERCLEVIWPNGNWRVCGDFFSEYDSRSPQFVYLDIDPKSSYMDVYAKLEWAGQALLAAHDLTYPDGRQWVLSLESAMRNDGWSTFGLPHERGFLVGLRP